MTTRLALSALIATLGLTVAQADDHRYKHTHTGSEQERINSDVSFGQPNDVKHAQAKLALELTDAGKVLGKPFGVEENDTVRFELKNSSNKAVAFVIGDKAAIDEFAQMFRTNPDVAANDFHATLVPAGQSKKFGWKFSTLNKPSVNVAFVGHDGTVQDRLLTMGVHTSRNRN